MAEDTRELPPVSFSNFVVSLAQSALIHLGEAKAPDGAEAPPNLPLARNTIDLLGMLEEKTEGNLDDDEKKLVETVLYELRTKFVEKTETADA